MVSVTSDIPATPARLDAERLGIAAAFVLGVTACLSAWIGAGQPILAVDDGYVHLALAESLRSGGWGLAGDPTAAGSSSILWPWLLAPLADGGPAGVIWAQALACIGLAAAQGLGARLLREAGLAPLPAAIATIFILTCAAGPAHAAAGMEHCAHAAATLAGLLAILRLGRGLAPGSAVLAFAATAPLWRYEGLALFALLLAALVLARRPATAGLILTGVALAAGLNAGMAVAHGAPALPVSLTDRGGLAGGPDLAGILAGPWARPALLAGLVLAGLAAMTRAPVAFAGLALLGAHMIAGEFGERGRLDFYATTAGWLAVLAAGAPLLPRLGRPVPLALAGALALAALCKSHLVAVLDTPAAARDLSRTALAARIVADAVEGPVGADGMGLIAYGADHRVVDLVGWGSAAPRDALREGRWASWADQAMAGAGARLAILSATQAPDPDPRWRAVGEIALDGPQRSSSTGPLRLWATRAADCPLLATTAARVLEGRAIWRPAQGCGAR
jgi:hypothetical protein